MLTNLHNSLRLLLHRGGIDLSQIDVRFETPTKEWMGSLIRPTVNVLLTDLQENVDLRHSGAPAPRGGDGNRSYLPPRRIDVRYSISVFAPEAEDHYSLLWRTLVLFLQHSELPADLVPEELKASGVPVGMRVAQPDDASRLREWWTGLDVPPRPALALNLTVAIDAEALLRSPMVLSRTLKYYKLGNADKESHVVVGGVVRDPAGNPLVGVEVRFEGGRSTVTDEAGRYLLPQAESNTAVIIVRSKDQREWRRTLPTLDRSFDLEIDSVSGHGADTGTGGP